MGLAFLIALCVGGSTIIGAIIGFAFKNISHKVNDAILGFAAGVMLAASIIGLIIPSIESGGKHGVWVTVAGILCGAIFLSFIDRFTPHLHNITGIDIERHENTAALNKVLLFVMAIAIHNFPEGLAAGVSFGSGNISNAISVASGISLQNIPEGLIIISPLLGVGVSRKRAFSIAVFTGVIEIVGTMIGYFSVSFAIVVLPFSLAFAGGTMLYIISDEIIPETHSHGHERFATFALLIGFALMLIMNNYIG